MTAEQDKIEDDLSPVDYFQILKGKVDTINLQRLEKANQAIKSEIIRAKSLNQKNLLHKLSFVWEILEKEVVLEAAGYTRYIELETVTNFVSKVKPKGSVKVAELENFPRVIPEENSKEIQKAIELQIFDEIVIVYTDLTNEEVLSPEQKKFVNKNRDPIAFGMFTNPKLRYNHERLYLITDWEDEYCELTFAKMIDKMAEMKILDTSGVMSDRHLEISKIVAEAKAEVDNIDLIRLARQEPKRTWISKFTKFFK